MQVLYEDDRLGYQTVPYAHVRWRKLGPRGAVWQQKTVSVKPGPRTRKAVKQDGGCWLCGAAAQVHEREWTRPGRTRMVTTQRQHFGPYLMHRHEEFRQVPKSKLRILIYACPNGCDADDELEPLLAALQHEGPSRSPW